MATGLRDIEAGEKPKKKSLVTIRIGESISTCDMAILRSKSKHFEKYSENMPFVHIRAEYVCPTVFSLLYEWMEGKYETDYDKSVAMEAILHAAFKSLEDYCMHQHAKQVPKGEEILERMEHANDDGL